MRVEREVEKEVVMGVLDVILRSLVYIVKAMGNRSFKQGRFVDLKITWSECMNE